MKRLAGMFFCMLLLSVAGVQGDVIRLTAIEDTYVDSMDTSGVFGNEELLNIQGTAPGMFSLGSIQQTFLKFELEGAIPENAMITAAVFGIYYAGQQSGGFTTADPSAFLYYVSDDTWSEDTLDWDAAQSLGSNPDPLTGDPYTLGDEDTAHEWDLFSGSGFNWTGWQVDLDDGYISFLMTVELEEVNNYANFYSSEYGTASMRPYLDITYTVVPEPTSMALTLIGISSLAAIRKKSNNR